MPGKSKKGGGLEVGSAYKMKGSPFQRNFGIGSPAKQGPGKDEADRLKRAREWMDAEEGVKEQTGTERAMKEFVPGETSPHAKVLKDHYKTKREKASAPKVGDEKVSEETPGPGWERLKGTKQWEYKGVKSPVEHTINKKPMKDGWKIHNKRHVDNPKYTHGKSTEL